MISVVFVYPRKAFDIIDHSVHLWKLHMSMVGTEVVLIDQNLIFMTKVKDGALLAISQMLHWLLVASLKAASSLDHFCS